MIQVKSFALDDVVVETVSGEIDLAASREILRQAVAADASAVLIDCRTSRKTLSFGDVLRLVDEARHNAALRAKRIALLASPFNRAEITQLIGARFAEEGFAIRDFYAYDEALAWLEDPAA